MTSDDPVSGRAAAGHVTLRYWASLRAAAGVDEDVVEVSGQVSLGTLTARALSLHCGGRFEDLLGTCSVMVGDLPVSSEDPKSVSVAPGSTVEFLPPFAGG